jgi:ribonucleotide reductase alpha subunit
MALRMRFDSPEAKELNIQIFEAIYHGALEASCEIAAKDELYETWVGSPAEQGQLQYDLRGVTPTNLWDWSGVKQKIAQHGLRNSLLVAPLAMASASQMLGFNECFEPYTRCGVIFLKLLFDQADIDILTATSRRAVSLLRSSKSSTPGFSTNSSTSVSGMPK